jgi:cell division protein FtsB
MEPESKENTPLIPPPMPASPSAPPESPMVSPWEQFLVGKKVSAEKFLAAMTKGAVTIPDEVTRQRFVDALLAKKDRMARFIPLLQASAASGETLRNIVAEFAEAVIRRLQLIAIPETLDASSFSASVSSWLASIRKKPLAPHDLYRLFLLLHFGTLRQLLEQDAAFGFVAGAVAKSGKPSRKTYRDSTRQTQMEVLLSVVPSHAVLVSLVAFAKVTDLQMVELNQRITDHAFEISELNADVARLKATLSEFEVQIAKLKDEKGTAEQKIRELEREIVDIRDGYQHKLDTLRGRIRGVLEGQLTRWVETALDASRSEPPFMQAVLERLEETLKLIKKEAQCLQPSV